MAIHHATRAVLAHISTSPLLSIALPLVGCRHFAVLPGLAPVTQSLGFPTLVQPMLVTFAPPIELFVRVFY